MPLYEYVCGGCGKTFDMLRSMAKADEPVDCPACHALNSKRAISRFAAHVQGSDGSSSSAAGSGGGCAGCGRGSCSGCHH